jgi:hypothetical protein
VEPEQQLVGAFVPRAQRNASSKAMINTNTKSAPNTGLTKLKGRFFTVSAKRARAA